MRFWLASGTTPYLYYVGAPTSLIWEMPIFFDLILLGGKIVQGLRIIHRQN
jgi:hypothetical protein